MCNTLPRVEGFYVLPLYYHWCEQGAHQLLSMSVPEVAGGACCTASLWPGDTPLETLH